ncbi:hypothetical protein CR513_02066, partial [Mucuna pruriens]
MFLAIKHRTETRTNCEVIISLVLKNENFSSTSWSETTNFRLPSWDFSTVLTSSLLRASKLPNFFSIAQGKYQGISSIILKPLEDARYSKGTYLGQIRANRQMFVNNIRQGIVRGLHRGAGRVVGQHNCPIFIRIGGRSISSNHYIRSSFPSHLSILIQHQLRSRWRNQVRPLGEWEAKLEHLQLRQTARGAGKGAVTRDGEQEAAFFFRALSSRGTQLDDQSSEERRRDRRRSPLKGWGQSHQDRHKRTSS